MYGQWRPYVPVAQRRAQGTRHAANLAKKLNRNPQPVIIAGRKMASTFWGQAWCDHIEKLSDFANRLPRGRTYARNGSIVDLDIQRGKVTAVVSGSDVYSITIKIEPLDAKSWKALVQKCGQSIDSLLGLLSGRIAAGTMQILTDPKTGMLPSPKDFKTDCSCPDWASLCKHLAAVLYGVGARLDKSPELLFLLRGVDASDLVSAGTATSVEQLDTESQITGDLSEIFGIEVDTGETLPQEQPTKSTRKRSPRKSVAVPEAAQKQITARKAKATAKLAPPPLEPKQKQGAGRSPAKRTSKPIAQETTQVKPNAKKTTRKRVAVKQAVQKDSKQKATAIRALPAKKKKAKADSMKAETTRKTPTLPKPKPTKSVGKAKKKSRKQAVLA